MLYKFSLATIGVCVFYVLTAVGAFFNFEMFCKIGVLFHSFINLEKAQKIKQMEEFKMKNTLKSYFLGFLSAAVLVSGVTYAASATKTIEALYNNIKIYVDGIKIDPKDVTGNTVEPFIYNGTTYLPVRAVGEAIGKTVSWDETTQSVYLGEIPGKTQSWMEVCKPYEYINAKEYLASNGTTFTMSGIDYTNGFTMQDMVNKSEVCFNLNGRFNSLSFKVGHVDGEQSGDRKLNIYLDGNLAKSETLVYNGGTKTISLPLNGAMHLRFEIKDEGGSPVYGFADGVFK